MNLKMFLLLFAAFAFYVSIEIRKKINEPADIRSNYYLIGPDKIFKYYDSISAFNNIDGSVTMVRNDDTLNVDSIVYTMKLNTYTVK